MIQVTLKDDKVRFGEVLEEIRCFGVKVPLRGISIAQSSICELSYKGITGAPEGVGYLASSALDVSISQFPLTLILPLALPLILLPSMTHHPKRGHLRIARFRE